MQILTKKSLRTRLSLLTWFVAFTTIALATLGFAGLGFKQLCSTQAWQLKKHAQLLGHYSTPVFTLRNREAGNRLLASLATDPAIEAACLFDADQNCISRFKVTESMSFPFHLQNKPYRLASLERLEILSPVESAGRSIGFIYLRSNTQAAQAQFAGFARGAGIVGLVVIGLSWLLAIPLKRAILAPFVQLTEMLDKLADGDTTTPLEPPARTSPECRVVIEAVNSLLAKLAKASQDRGSAELDQRIAETNHGLAQELKRLHKHQHEIERARQVAEKASLAKSNFIVDMSQEIREPLDGIVAGVDELLENARRLGGDAENQLLEMQRSGAHLQQMLADAAEAATIDSGRVQLQQHSCLPHTMIAKVVEQFEEQANRQEIALEYRWRGSQEESCRCDAERLGQVVHVLVENAIRFTEVGGVRVTAGFEQGQDLRQLRIEVTDTGIGLSAEALATLFDASDQPSHIHHDGNETGMGLDHCQKLIVAMGGQINVSSSVGEGTSFTVLIDAAIDAVIAIATKSAPDTTSGPATPAQRLAGSEAPAVTTDPIEAPRILVVDDSDTNRDLTQLVLRRAGARVEGAENGLEAVQAAVRESFDLILMDMQMPVMDGFSATREIRAQGIAVPIIALTAYALDFDEQKCRAAGCIGHLTKPLDSEDLLAATQQALPPGRKLTVKARPVTPAQTAKTQTAKTQTAKTQTAKTQQPAAAARPQTPAVKHTSPYDLDLETATVAPIQS